MTDLLCIKNNNNYFLYRKIAIVKINNIVRK